MEKRTITLILALGLMFGSVLTGCSANTENSSPDRSSQPTEQEQTSVSGEPVSEDSSDGETADDSAVSSDSGNSQLAPEAPDSVVLENPDTDPDMTAEELAEIERMYLAQPTTSFHWQQVVVGSNDRIIPPDNQLNAWRKEEENNRKKIRVHYTEDAHYQVELFRYYLQDIWTKD